jgi:hypothetical protein
MDVLVRLERLVEQAKREDVEASSSDSPCRECNWREAYCLMEIAFRASELLRNAMPEEAEALLDEIGV